MNPFIIRGLLQFSMSEVPGFIQTPCLSQFCYLFTHNDLILTYNLSKKSAKIRSITPCAEVGNTDVIPTLSQK